MMVGSLWHLKDMIASLRCVHSHNCCSLVGGIYSLQFCDAVYVLQDHGGEMARQWNLLRASERFRVIAIGVPVPPYRYGCVVCQYVVVVSCCSLFLHCAHCGTNVTR